MNCFKCKNDKGSLLQKGALPGIKFCWKKGTSPDDTSRHQESTIATSTIALEILKEYW